MSAVVAAHLHASRNHAGNRDHSDRQDSSAGSAAFTKTWSFQNAGSKLARMPVTAIRKINTPFFVPAVQPLELFFFQRVYDHLVKHGTRQGPSGATKNGDGQGGAHEGQACPILSGQGDIFAYSEEARQDAQMDFDVMSSSSYSKPDKTQAESNEVPLVQFHRATVRLFRILQQPYPDVKVSGYDANMNGKVGWYEFCSFWKDNNIAVRLTWAERLFLTLEDAERSIMGRIMSMLVFLAIVISTGCFIVSTMPAFQSKCILEGQVGYDLKCKPKPDSFFKEVDLGCVIFFSIEYGLRLLLSSVMRTELADRDKHRLLAWIVAEDSIPCPHPMKRVSEFFFNPANLIDLAAIMPWFLSQAFKNSGGDDSVIIRSIRLTRVIRAFRLGSRFEAVIIIVRSIRRSLRALYVLVLNLLLGVIIFGALIYFCEQGKWDKEKKAYTRWVDQEWNSETQQWDDVFDRSPFESIPASFWWAVVTATTVGYGDQYPTTPAGKTVAGVSMAWSLCVLALPIGVIGNNFSQVWIEYDKEREKEKWDRIKEEMLLKRSIAWGDPLHYSRRILLEVWHDLGLPDDGQGSQQTEFMGEVDFTMDLPAKDPRSEKITCHLTPNYEKANRRVRGTITFEYRWRPAEKYNEDALLVGTLEVLVLQGSDLISIDWKDTCSSDPYCKIWAYPKSPEKTDGNVEPVCYRTDTVWDTSNPRWDFSASLEVNWTRAGTAQCMANDMRELESGVEPVQGPGGRPSAKKRKSMSFVGSVSGHLGKQTPVSQEQTANPVEEMNRTVPEIQAELLHFKDSIVPQLQSDMLEVKHDLHRIVEALKNRKGFKEYAMA
jgi:hypothetical protein